MSYNIVLRLPEGDQVDLECDFGDFMVAKATENPQFAIDNQWGESYVLQGNTLHGIQWKYVGLEPVYTEDYDENIDDELQIIGWEFEDGVVDFEVDCSWHEEENYDAS